MDLESAHLPFRGSKLTQVLKDSFRGTSARTVMIANIGPNSGAAEHTVRRGGRCVRHFWAARSG
jgi:hypothetical protein